MIALKKGCSRNKLRNCKEWREKAKALLDVKKKEDKVNVEKAQAGLGCAKVRKESIL